MKFRLLTVTGLAGLALAANAQDSTLSYRSMELAPGLYMLEGQGGFTGGNLGLLTGDDGVVLIDDGVPDVIDLTVRSVEALIGSPVDFLINTHAHADHTGGNAAMHGKGARIVAHENLRNRLVADGAVRDALPELTFADGVVFHLNGYTARVFHVPHAHTDGDAAIYFPEANVLHTGDVMFNKLFPFIDLDGGGSVEGYIAGQKKFLAMVNDTTKIIPGHGALASKADLGAALHMLEDARSRVQALIDAGKTHDEVMAANPLAPYQEWSWDFITTERMTETLYRSLSAD